MGKCAPLPRAAIPNKVALRARYCIASVAKSLYCPNMTTLDLYDHARYKLALNPIGPHQRSLWTIQLNPQLPLKLSALNQNIARCIPPLNPDGSQSPKSPVSMSQRPPKMNHRFRVLPLGGKRRSEIDGCSRLANPSLLVSNRDDFPLQWSLLKIPVSRCVRDPFGLASSPCSEFSM